MDLMTNATFRIMKELNPSTHYAPGIYRVILDEPRLDKTVCVLISPEDKARSVGGRNKKTNEQLKRRRKKPRPPMVGKLIWMDRSELHRLSEEHLLTPITIERAVITTMNKYNKKEYDKNVIAMALFLDLQKLHESIIVHADMGALVGETVKTAKVSRFYVYKHWSNLCRWGLDEKSLVPQRKQRCGAPGVKRPCNPPAEGLPPRKKAGRKTTEQRIAHHFGQQIDAIQPGMTLEWMAAIRAADKQISTPKPKWSTRCDLILKSAFCGKAKEHEGKIVIEKPELGKYPTTSQIKRVLTGDQSALERIIERTTKHYFTSAMRGLVARNWEGVAGPGHTWAIDSTVADIYCRSSVNRAWIVGRPIVYVIVDVWSTAIVGFYVCLTGPSWNTAKVSLFNAGAHPALVADMWGYQPIFSLSPFPTLPYALLGDRGEYLSAGQRSTAVKLIPLTSYTPPYRGDLKGSVEVLHRMEKDAQFLFLPGAIDYRRKELELRNIDPESCVLTVREYVHYLYQLFSHYNLYANREHRVDAHMRAIDVFPSPAGLWHWGHEMGVGYRKKVEEMDLILNLLPDATGSVTRHSIRHAGCDYMSEEVKEAQLTAIARNKGGWGIPLNYYPGSMSTIWTPNTDGAGLLRLSITDQSRASRELTVDEWADVLALQTIKRRNEEHERRMGALDMLANMAKLRDDATRATREALDRDSGIRPTMTEARLAEVAAVNHPSRSETKVAEELREEAMQTHHDMMAAVIAAANVEEVNHDAA